jgi:hypothetical protein
MDAMSLQAAPFLHGDEAQSVRHRNKTLVNKQPRKETNFGIDSLSGAWRLNLSRSLFKIKRAHLLQ